jgi:inosine-uridine nucleoside N-ribohydrolase
MSLPPLSELDRLARLQPVPTADLAEPAPVVLDTDTYNEIDDQFAVAWALLSPDRVDVQAIHAAPFHNERSEGPGDGMEKSFEEIQRLLERLDMSNRSDRVFRGSDRYLPGPGTPVDSPAARDLIERAMAATPERPLYVVAIGAITNIASAILLQPEIIERIVVVWLGGQPHDWPRAREFNLQQDIPASRLIFDSGVPLVHVPCANVAEKVKTTLAELEQFIAGKSRIADFLVERFRDFREDHFAWSKEIWDLAAIAWLITPDAVPTHLAHSPILTDQRTWSRDQSRHLIRVAGDCRRDPIFADVFRKLAAAP